jgi:hypothetical protein
MTNIFDTFGMSPQPISRNRQASEFGNNSLEAGYKQLNGKLVRVAIIVRQADLYN